MYKSTVLQSSCQTFTQWPLKYARCSIAWQHKYTISQTRGGNSVQRVKLLLVYWDFHITTTSGVYRERSTQSRKYPVVWREIAR